jgi:hypothetical protein
MDGGIGSMVAGPQAGPPALAAAGGGLIPQVRGYHDGGLVTHDHPHPYSGMGRAEPIFGSGLFTTAAKYSNPVDVLGRDIESQEPMTPEALEASYQALVQGGVPVAEARRLTGKEKAIELPVPTIGFYDQPDTTPPVELPEPNMSVDPTLVSSVDTTGGFSEDYLNTSNNLNLAGTEPGGAAGAELAGASLPPRTPIAGPVVRSPSYYEDLRKLIDDMGGEPPPSGYTEGDDLKDLRAQIKDVYTVDPEAQRESQMQSAAAALLASAGRGENIFSGMGAFGQEWTGEGNRQRLANEKREQARFAAEAALNEVNENRRQAALSRLDAYAGRKATLSGQILPSIMSQEAQDRREADKLSFREKELSSLREYQSDSLAANRARTDATDRSTDARLIGNMLREKTRQLKDLRTTSMGQDPEGIKLLEEEIQGLTQQMQYLMRPIDL